MKTKLSIRTAFCMICVVVGISLLLAASFYYVTSCKKTLRDTSVSPDGAYELTLFEIGEPAWPFGPASGCLILKQDGIKISKTNFQLANDGARISDRDWTVVWHEAFVEVILSGEEQFDEQVWLYFDGTTQRRSLTDGSDDDFN